MNMLAIMLATTVNFNVQTAVHPDDFKTYDTAKTRSPEIAAFPFPSDRVAYRGRKLSSV